VLGWKRIWAWYVEQVARQPQGRLGVQSSEWKVRPIGISRAFWFLLAVLEWLRINRALGLPRILCCTCL
jgi:hypothetical protein